MAKARRAVSEGPAAVWSETFKAMGDGTRLSILLTLLQGEQCVTDIAKGLKMDAPKVSFHLTRLKYSGLVVQERQGQRMVYRMNPEVVKKGGDGLVLDVEGCVFTFRKRWVHVLDAVSGRKKIGKVDARGKGAAGPRRRAGRMEETERGLLPEEVVRAALEGLPAGLVLELRGRLATRCRDIREKLHPKRAMYIGYGTGSEGDAVYVYVQKKRLMIDLKIREARADELRKLGFEVRPQRNYQGAAGWLTGWIVPHDTDKVEVVVKYAVEALTSPFA